MKIIHTFRSPLRLLAVLVGFLALGSGAWGQVTGVSHEVVATTAAGTTYRLYANFTSATDRLGSVFGVLGQDGVDHPMTFTPTTSFYQDPLGADLGQQIIPQMFGFAPSVQYDSWFTIGSENNTGSGGVQLTSMTAPLAAFNAGNGFTTGGATGGTWYTIGATADGVAGADLKVLFAQLTVAHGAGGAVGHVSGTVNFQWFPGVGTGINAYDFTFNTASAPAPVTGCTNSAACNFNALANTDDGSCVVPTGCDTCSGGAVVDGDTDNDGICNVNEIVGCTISTACNYNAATTDANNALCTYATDCDTCAGGVVVDGDTDDDGVCNIDEVAGCTIVGACNYDADATDNDGTCDFTSCVGCMNASACNYSATATTDNGSCVFATGCDFCQGGAVVDGDTDNDQVCDIDEVSGCTTPGACNYNASASEDDGTCVSATGCDFCAGGVVVDGDADNDLICDGDEVIGCTLVSACNFNPNATDSDNASCVFATGCDSCVGGAVVDGDADDDGTCDINEIAGCQDNTACNYNPAATDGGVTCNYPQPGRDCAGACLLDFDGDGVCNDDEVGGCMDSDACNFDTAATDDDGSCTYPPLGGDCSSVCTGDFDGDGICNNFEVEGCMSSSASNYDPAATDDDGSCTWPGTLFEGLTYEVIPQSAVPGATTYRLYANFSVNTVQMAAAYGTMNAPWSISSTEPFYQDAFGSLYGNEINPAFYVAAPSLASDSWLAFGAGPGQSPGPSQVGMTNFTGAFSSAGGNILIDTQVGASLYYTPGASQWAFPQAGRVLLGQFTTEGVVSVRYNLQFRDPNQNTIQITDIEMQFPTAAPGCTDNTACNFNALATVDNGSCEFLSCQGCTAAGACNYDATATVDDGSCEYTSCLGCMNAGACNYDETATINDAASCEFLSCAGCMDAGACNFDGTATISDAASCEYLSCAGCTNAAACNYDATATLNDGSCILVTQACDFCQEGALVDGDADNDGICNGDEVVGCQDATACNYNELATDADDCIFADPFRDCAGVCDNDADNDDVCDEEEVPGCQDPLAVNYNADATDADGTCQYGYCNDPLACNYDAGMTPVNPLACQYPAPYFDCDGVCTGDYDGDGICEGEEVEGCASASALNYNPAATNDDGSCVWGSGTFQGLTYEVVNDHSDASSPLYGTGNVTYRVYAQFDDTEMDLVKLFGNAAKPWLISSTAPIYQHPLGVDFGGTLNPGFFAFQPALAYDSWITIGAAPGDFNALSQSGMFTYFPAWNAGGSLNVNGNPGGNISVAPAETAQGQPDAEGRVLVAQLTTAGVMTLRYNVEYTPTEGTTQQYWDVELVMPARVSGCTNPVAVNYDEEANSDDGTCVVTGCTDDMATNYNPEANSDDGTCLVYGCMDAEADNYLPNATVDQGCEYLGCTDATADNFDPGANVDDASCIYLGCMDADADNYDATANQDDGSCFYLGCTNAIATNYDATATVDDGSCIIPGCTIEEAVNFDPVATQDDGSCVVYGCTYDAAENFNPYATIDDGSCLFPTPGCMDLTAWNYDAGAAVDNGTCLYGGCTYVDAVNYNPAATVDDNTCFYEGCIDPGAANYNPIASDDDGSCLYVGCMDPEGLDYDPTANYPGGCDYPSNCPGDIDGTGFVDVQDLLTFFQYYGTSCPE